MGCTWSEAQKRELCWKSSPLKAVKISQEGMDWIKKKSYPRSLCLFGNTESERVVKIPESENGMTPIKQEGHSSSLIVHLPLEQTVFLALPQWLYSEGEAVGRRRDLGKQGTLQGWRDLSSVLACD